MDLAVVTECRDTPCRDTPFVRNSILDFLDDAGWPGGFVQGGVEKGPVPGLVWEGGSHTPGRGRGGKTRKTTKKKCKSPEEGGHGKVVSVERVEEGTLPTMYSTRLVTQK